MIFAFISILVIVAIFVGTIAGAIAYYVRTSPKRTSDFVDEIHKAAEKITEPAKPLIKVIQHDSTAPSSSDAFVSNILGTDNTIENVISRKPVLYDAFIQALALTDDAILDIQEIRRETNQYAATVRYFRLMRLIDGKENTVIMVLHTANYPTELWEKAPDCMTDIEGWANDGQITICNQIDFFTRAIDCDPVCQTEIVKTVKAAAKTCGVNRVFVKTHPDQAFVYQFYSDAEMGLIISPVAHSIRKFTDQKLFALSYDSPTCAIDGMDYKPPINSLIKHAVNVLKESRHIAFIGAPGVGKTVLSEHLISEFIAQNPDTYILKMEVSDLSLIASPKGRTVITSFIKNAISNDKRILLWIDEAQSMIQSADLTTLLQLMDGTSQKQDSICVVACLNEERKNLPSAFESRLTLVAEFKKLTRVKAEELLKYIVEQTNAGVNKHSSFLGTQVSLRDVYNSVYPKTVIDNLHKEWKSYKYNPPAEKHAEKGRR